MLDGLGYQCPRQTMRTPSAQVVRIVPQQRLSTHFVCLPVARYRQLNKEIQDLRAELERLVRGDMAPTLIEAFGVGPDTAADSADHRWQQPRLGFTPRLPSHRCAG